MFPFRPVGGPRADVMRMRQAMELENMFNAMAFEGAVHDQALNRGRIQGYRKAVRDLDGIGTFMSSPSG